MKKKVVMESVKHTQKCRVTGCNNQVPSKWTICNDCYFERKKDA